MGYRPFVVVVSVAFGCWSLFWIVTKLLGPSSAELGQWGDSFGALNALFSGLAFGGLILALLLQGKQLEKQSAELELQREELRLTREELARTTEAQQGSQAALEKQQEYLSRSAQAQALAALTQMRDVAWEEIARATIVDVLGKTKYAMEEVHAQAVTLRQFRDRFVTRVVREMLGMPGGG